MAPAAVIAHDPDRELRELREYLGDEFDRGRLQRYEQTLDGGVPAGCGDEEALLPDVARLPLQPDRVRDVRHEAPVPRELSAPSPARRAVLDYGCGIGADGLLLLEAGYRVEFADFDNPSIEYLRWRLGAAASRRRSTTSTATSPAASTPPTPST